MYPLLRVDLNKIEHNSKVIAERCAAKGIKMMGVTKSFCALPEVAQAMVDGGAEYLADSRIENLQKFQDIDVPKILIRLPMNSKLDKVVKYADVSLNSELKTIRALSDEAKKQNKVHKIILMADLGDLREGVLPGDIMATVEEILKCGGVQMIGLGVNLTCYGGVVPSTDNLGELGKLATEIEEKYGIELEIVSGGNSSSYFLVENDTMPDKVNNLRMGEILVLGRETAFGNKVKGTYEDAFTFHGEIIEVKEKDSVPKGEIGMDAFGNKPTFVDKGKMRRAIVAVGRQDVNPEGLTPHDDKIEILGASSDHLLLNITESEKEYNVGDIMSFNVDYGALLELSTSQYVDKKCVK